MTHERLRDAELDPDAARSPSGHGTPGTESAAVGRRPADLLPRSELEQLTERSDAIGAAYLVAHYALIGVGGWLTWQYRLDFAFIPILLIHAVIIGFLFSPLHECAHGTAFRTGWLNEAALWVTALVYIVPPYYFRYFHLGHHRFTQVPGKDPSLVLPEPARFRQYLWYCAGLWFFWRNLSWIVKHAVGMVDASSAQYVPAARRHLLVLEARILVLVYASIGLAAAALGLAAPLLLCWLLPRVLGEPVQRIIRVAEHVGCAETPELLDNTRTTLTHPLINAIAWQMPYHAEHHLFPNVPFHALPALHARVGSKVIVEPRGYLAGQRKIVHELWSRPPTGKRDAPGPML